MSAVRVIVLDKTGTITLGKPKVLESTGDVLALAASVEAPSEHPLAKAIVDEARSRGLQFSSVQKFVARPGIGVSGMVDGRQVEVVSSEQRGGVDVLVDGVKSGSILLADED